MPTSSRILIDPNLGLEAKVQLITKLYTRAMQSKEEDDHHHYHQSTHHCWMSWAGQFLHEHHHPTSCAHNPVFWKWLRRLEWISTYCDPIRGEPGSFLPLRILKGLLKLTLSHNSTCFYCPCQQPAHHAAGLKSHFEGGVRCLDLTHLINMQSPLLWKPRLPRKLNVNAVTRKHQELWECVHIGQTRPAHLSFLLLCLQCTGITRPRREGLPSSPP